MGDGGAGDRRDGRVGVELEAHAATVPLPDESIRATSLHELLHAWPQETAQRCVITSDRPMSPLLNTRPSERVMHRLLAACLVMAALAVVIAISAGDYGRPSGAAPAFLGAGAVCAALVAYLLAASARAVGDPRLLWMAAGVGRRVRRPVREHPRPADDLPDRRPGRADRRRARRPLRGLARRRWPPRRCWPSPACARRPGGSPRLIVPSALLLAWTRRRRRAARRPRDARERVHGAAEAARRADRARPGRRRRRLVARGRTARPPGARCA